MNLKISRSEKNSEFANYSQLSKDSCNFHRDFSGKNPGKKRVYFDTSQSEVNVERTRRATLDREKEPDTNSIDPAWVETASV